MLTTFLPAAPPAPEDALGLGHFTVELPNQTAYDEVVARVDEAGLPSNQTEAELPLHYLSQNGVMLAIAGQTLVCKGE